MFLDINTIGQETVSFDRDLTLGNLEGAGGDLVTISGSRLRGEASRAGNGVEFNARLEARLEMPCSRCLERFAIEVDTEFHRLLVAEVGEVEGQTQRVPEDDEETLRVAGGQARLEDIATEQLYLNLPLKPVCSTGCKGLCPRCGSNRNLGACGCRAEDLDPRLAPLLEFRRRQERS